MSIVQPSSGECPIVPDDRYEATIVSTKDIDLDTPDQFGKTAKLEIKVAFEVDGEEVTLDPRVNRAWSEKATLFKIATAAGLEVNPFEAFDTARLNGRRLRIDTEQEEGKWPRVTGWAKLVGSRKQPEAKASQTPSLITPDNTVDWTAYWAYAKEKSVSQKMVAAELDGDLQKLKDMDAADCVLLLETLIAGMEDDIPFEP